MATAEDYSIDESHCVLCCEDMDYSACGSCDHPICLKCCVKLRLLRKEHDCPICRAQLKEVIVSKGYKSWADKKTAKPRRQQHARNYGILHESPESQAKVDELLEHRCTECNEVFRSFPQVKDHVRKAHSMMFCDICLRHLKIFTHERKCYTREDLVRHRKEGDMDDRSHRGHPSCRFCDERYLDNDELLAHLRKHHFWCHLCEKDGKQDYYANYDDLRRHFKRNHFLCEDGECLHEKYTSVFRLKVDYQAHVAQKHSNKLTKAEARQMRQLDINITFARREDPNSIVSAEDFNFPEQGYERYRERPKITSSAKDKDGRRETQRNQNVTSNDDFERYRQTSLEMRGTENSRGARRSNIRSPRDVLEGDHKRPPGSTGDAKTNDKKIFDGNNKIRNVDQAEKKTSKSGKVGADDGKTRKNKSKKKELLEKNLADAKTKQQSLDKNGLSGPGKKNDSSSLKTKSQETNDSSSDQKADPKSKSQNNNSTREKTVNNSPPQKPDNVSQEKNTGPSSSSVVQSPPNTEGDFTALSADKKQEAPVNIVKPRLTYHSEFPSLSSELSQQNSSIRPPPGLAPPPGFSVKLKLTPDQTGPAEAKIESRQKVEQFADLYKVTSKNKLTQAETQKQEKLSANKSSARSSVPDKLVPKPTYETEFPTLSALTNGHKASSSVKAPPGFASSGFQPGIPARPPPGMGWSVPVNIKAPYAKETRIQKLINDIRRILNLRSESFERFQEVSRLYRQGKSSPDEYYQECCSLFGKEHIQKVFRGLIDILPDEEKRQQLLVVYNDAKVKAKLEGIFNTSEFEGNSDTERMYSTEEDRIENGLISPPSLEYDFPEFCKTSAKKSKSAAQVSNAWTRGK